MVDKAQPLHHAQFIYETPAPRGFTVNDTEDVNLSYLCLLASKRNTHNFTCVSRMGDQVATPFPSTITPLTLA